MHLLAVATVSIVIRAASALNALLASPSSCSTGCRDTWIVGGIGHLLICCRVYIGVWYHGRRQSGSDGWLLVRRMLKSWWHIHRSMRRSRRCDWKLRQIAWIMDWALVAIGSLAVVSLSILRTAVEGRMWWWCGWEITSIHATTISKT